MWVSVQVSVYPLGQNDLAPAIEAVWRVFQEHRLACQPGPMPRRRDGGMEYLSTLLEGDDEAVFAALREAFPADVMAGWSTYRAASELGATVMAATASNACPRASQKKAVG